MDAEAMGGGRFAKPSAIRERCCEKTEGGRTTGMTTRPQPEGSIDAQRTKAMTASTSTRLRTETNWPKR